MTTLSAFSVWTIKSVCYKKKTNENKDQNEKKKTRAKKECIVENYCEKFTLGTQVLVMKLCVFNNQVTTSTYVSYYM